MAKIFKTNSGHNWTYCSLGGEVRVKICTGEDIAHLDELDPKLWTVLSCPTKGFNFDSKTLELLDCDKDGRIRVDEVVAASKWLTSLVNNKDLILEGRDAIDLSEINTDTDLGAKLAASAKHVLSNLGLEKDSISVADTDDSVAIFAKTKFNGDGIITEASAEEDTTKAAIASIIATTGSVADRSGAPGINATLADTFYAQCADFAAWSNEAEADKETIFPLGTDTDAALTAVEAVKAKVDDYFMRCKLINFDADAASALDIPVDRIKNIAEGNIASQTDEISSYPIARPGNEGILPYDGINPAWTASFAAVRTLLLDKEYPAATGINEAQWQAATAKLAPYSAWKNGKKGASVESLGIDTVKEMLSNGSKDTIADLIARDNELAEEAGAIEALNKLTHLYRDLFKFLNNFISLTDFYSTDTERKAVFEEGRLIIEHRSCNLCMRVVDPVKQAEMSDFSGMFLIYCTCTSKVKNETMNIVAIMTQGNTKNIRAGVNAIFYDRDGQDWDAVVTKVVDNPISIKQAFFRPYLKLVDNISDRMAKNAAEKETKILTANVEEAKATVNGVSNFDIAKFAGIFAAIGMAVSGLAAALTKLINPWYNILYGLLALVIFISGPSMFLAWRKLRRRNLGPILNANGWAVNSCILINVPFGASLTTMASYPRLNLEDPYKVKKTPAYIKILAGILFVAAILAILYFTGNLSQWIKF